MNRAESYPLTVTRYWKAVTLCLVEFHKYQFSQASEAVERYQNEVQKEMKDFDLIYHEEPFYLACDISDGDLPLTEYRDAYATVLRAVR